MIALLLWGFNYGIDFTGGTLLEVRFKDGRPAVNDVRQAIEGLEPGNLILQPIGESSLILRFQDTSEDKHQAVLEKLREWRLYKQKTNKRPECGFEQSARAHKKNNLYKSTKSTQI